LSTEKLPQWQTDRLDTLLDALGGISLGATERESLTWLAGFETATVENIAAVIRRARLQSSTLAVREAQGKQFSRERSRQSALCQLAGIDPGDDPLNALIRNLRAHDPSGGRS